jgi:protocatechuate 3,4-dioxygenase beta subunit
MAVYRVAMQMATGRAGTDSMAGIAEHAHGILPERDRAGQHPGLAVAFPGCGFDAGSRAGRSPRRGQQRGTMSEKSSPTIHVSDLLPAVSARRDLRAGRDVPAARDVPPELGRRQVLGGLAWMASAPAVTAAFGCGSEEDEPVTDVSESALGGAPMGPTNSTPLQVPAWDDVPACSASNIDGAGQGPFFIHDTERDDDVSLTRQDIRGRYDAAAEPGVEMQLHVRVLDATNGACNAAPMAGLEVYIWHTDAQGYYSGFGEPGDQRPDDPYAGVPNQNDLKNTDRFCRGVQLTDANGVVSFKSIFPGWYNGRDVHIHLVVLRPGSASRGRVTYSGGEHVFTTQFYFDPEFTDRVHRSGEPYLRRTALPAYEGAIQADEPSNSGLHAKASFDRGVVVAQMQVLLDPRASVG